MRSIKVLGLAFVAVLAFSAIAVASASAETFSVEAAKNPFVATSGTTNLIDNGTELECNESTATTELKEGGAVNGSELGEITEVSWNKGSETCSGPLNIQFKVLALTPWNLLGYQLLNEGDLVDGAVSGIVAHIEGSLCSFTVSGSTPAVWHNEAQSLTFSLAVNELAEKAGWATNTLTVENVSGCFGLIENGDKPYFEGLYEAEAGAGVLIK